MNTPSTNQTSASAASTPGADASVGLRALPNDLLERIVEESAHGCVRILLRNGPSVAHAVLGPGSLREDGAAYRLTAGRLWRGWLQRWRRDPTWKALVFALRREQQGLPEEHRDLFELQDIFYVACRRGLYLVTALCIVYHARIDEHPDLCKERPHGKTPLMLASERGHEHVVTILLSAKADVNAHDMDATTALHLVAGVAEKGGRSKGQWSTEMARVRGTGERIRIAEALLAAGARVNATTVVGQTALMGSCRAGHLTMVGMLLAARADPNATSAYFDYPDGSALDIACARGHMDIVTALLAGGVDVNLRHYGGRTSLVGACARNQLDMAAALIAGRADVNAVDDAGETALMHASWTLNGAVVEALRAAGADAALRNRGGDTASDLRCHRSFEVLCEWGDVRDRLARERDREHEEE